MMVLFEKENMAALERSSKGKPGEKGEQYEKGNEGAPKEHGRTVRGSERVTTAQRSPKPSAL